MPDPILTTSDTSDLSSTEKIATTDDSLSAELEAKPLPVENTAVTLEASVVADVILPVKPGIPVKPVISEYNLIAYGGTGLGYGREPGFRFQADTSNTAHVVAQDDDAILNDWSTGNYHGTPTPGIYNGDTGSTVISSEIPWLEPGEMITSGVWYELSYEDPETGEIEQVEVFLIWDDTNNYWGGYDNSFVFATAPLIDGVVYTVTSVDNNAGVPWDVLICFVGGTLIETAQGLADVENLVAGDLVITLDHGLQPIRWIGSRTVDAGGKFAPICIRKGALGNHRDLFVSPQHRLLFKGALAEMYFGESEVLVAAKHLVNGKTIQKMPARRVTYYHLLFDTHEIILSEGIPSESLHPNQNSLRGVSKQSRQEILTLFPELAVPGGTKGKPARPCIRKHEASLLAVG